MQRTYLTGAIICWMIVLSGVMYGQAASSYPTELYSGENIITLKAPGGIRSIQANFDSLTSSLTEIHGMGGIGDLSGCPDSHKVQLRLNTASQPVNVRFTVIDCAGRQHQVILTNKTWRLDEVPFPDAEVGDTICRPFQIGLTGIVSEYLDSISIPMDQVFQRYSFPPPLPLRAGSNYRYTVCFVAEKPGEYRFPVMTWIRRTQPAGGYTNYAVSDTGVVRVLPKRKGPELSRIDIDTAGSENPEPVTDPTTFRSIAVPNAVIPPRGKWFVGNYDLLGWTGGYSVANELLLFAGGAPPLPDDWGGINGDMFWAGAAGAKLGTSFGKFSIAGGYAFAVSTLDKELTPDELDSRIYLNIPFAAVSYGTDDSRVSLTGGVALKRHSTWVLEDNHRVEFDTAAYFGALGGDYRFARHWKVAGEFALMQTLDVAPLLVTARYFTNTFAIDAGLGYAGFTLNDADKPKFPFVPVLSAVFVF